MVPSGGVFSTLIYEIAFARTVFMGNYANFGCFFANYRVIKSEIDIGNVLLGHTYSTTTLTTTNDKRQTTNTA